MIARVDGQVVPSDALWWPPMNFGQFRWDHPLGDYELSFPRADFVRRLESVYEQCAAELRADDELVPGQSSPLTDAGYPPLDQLPEHPAAFFEAVAVFLWEDVFEEFLSWPPSAARFMINSVEAVSASPAVVLVRGRGYHAAPRGTGHVGPSCGGQKLDCTKAPVYRGNGTKGTRPNVDVKVDKKTGLMIPEKSGLSVPVDQQKLLGRFPSAPRVKSLPDELQIIQQGKDPGHLRYYCQAADDPGAVPRVVKSGGV